jgi:hypothetical protein
MNSLRELIRHGDYELAAYRLVYGLVREYVEQCRRDGAAISHEATGSRHGDAGVAQGGLDCDG